MKLRGIGKFVPVAMALSLFTGCAKDNFQKMNYTASAVAGQYNYVNPKLDVVIFQDNSSSMAQPNAIVQSQLNSFLAGINSGWDFRFIMLPLQSTQSLSSKYVVAEDCSSVYGVGRCLSPSDIGTFINAGGNAGWIKNIDSSIGNVDYGFQNMIANLGNLNGFLRQDAVLAIVVVTNGEDISGGATYNQWGWLDESSTLMQSTFNSYLNQFQNLKAAVPLTRFYSVVAAQRYQNCYGGIAFQGLRYMNMANALGGMSVDLCSGGINNVLPDFANQLQTVTQTIVFNYIVLPDQASHVNTVYKNGQALPSNQWKYVGYQSNQPTSYEVCTSSGCQTVAGNYRSGYMIQLIGTDYRGNDQISVDYQK